MTGLWVVILTICLPGRENVVLQQECLTSACVQQLYDGYQRFPQIRGIQITHNGTGFLGFYRFKDYDVNEVKS